MISNNSIVSRRIIKPSNLVRLIIVIALLMAFLTSSAQYRYTGAIGTPNFIFDNPVGVAIDQTNGWFYVSNYGRDQILGFSIATRQYLFAIGNTGTSAGEFVHPTGLATDSNGNLYVSELGNSGNGRVQRFRSDGSVDPTFNFGFPIAGLNTPNQLAVDSDVTRDRLYVAESGADRIGVYSRAGVLMGYLTTASVGTTIDNPLGVAVSADGTVYIANTGASNIVRVPYNSSVASMTSTLTMGVNTPYHLAINPSNGHLVVTRINDHYLTRFDTNSNLAVVGSDFGGSGAGNSQFSQPSGIAIDNSGNTYVAEYGNNRMQGFTSALAWSWTLGTTITFNGAAGVAINENSGKVYACDYGNHRVQVFDKASGALSSIFSGTGSNALVNPIGVAVGPAPNYFIYVTEASSDFTHHRIQRFNSAGNYDNVSFTGALKPYQILVLPGTAGADTILVADQRGTVYAYNTNFTTQYFSIAVGSTTRGIAVDEVNRRLYAIDNNGASTYIRAYNLNSNNTTLMSKNPDLSIGGGDGIIGDDAGEVDLSDVISNLAFKPGSPGTLYATQTSISYVYTINAVTGAQIDIPARGGPGTAAGKFNNPVGIAVASDGTYYVGDFNNHRVQGFAANGTVNWNVGSQASSNANGSLSQPSDVAFASNGRVYIADRNNHRIQVFNSSGAYLAKVDNGSGSGDNQLTNPSGVFADGSLLYVADWGNHRIQIFDISSATQTTNPATHARFGTGGSGGSGATDLRNPAGIWVTSNLIYVADQSNDRIQVFDKTTYAHVQQITSVDLSQPVDVAVDAAGNVFVASKSNSSLVVYNSSGTHITTISGPALGNNFSSPEGVFVDANGVVYVSDTQNNRLVAFSLCGGTSWATNWRAHWVHNNLYGFGSSGQSASQFREPLGIGMDPTTYRMIISDRGNARAQIFVPLPYINIRRSCTNIADGSGSFSFGTAGIPNDAGSLPYTHLRNNNPVSQQTFVIENLGNAQLTLNTSPRVSISGTGAGSFNISEGSLSGAGGTFAPQVSRTFTLQFRPLSSGAKSAMLTLATNEDSSTGRNSYSFGVSGTPIATTSYTYTWTDATGNHNFQDQDNWSPAGVRGTGEKWDILIFQSSGDVQNVPSDTVGALIFASGAKINFSPAAAGTILVVKGRVGTDLQLPSSTHELNIVSDNAMELHLLQVGGTLSGKMSLKSITPGANPAHRLIVKNTAVTFDNNSVFDVVNLSGNPFGTSSGNNMVVFDSGSTFISRAGADPFGLPYPDSKVLFQIGSTYSHRQSTISNMSNRTICHLEYDDPGTLSFSTPGAVVTLLGDLVVRQGIVQVTNDQPIAILGNVNVMAGTEFKFMPVTPGVGLMLTGSSSTTFGGAGAITFNSNSELVIAKSNPAREVSLQSHLSMPGVIRCTSGDLNLNNGYSINLGTTGSLVEDLMNSHIVTDTWATFDYKVNTCIPGATGPCMTGVVGGTVVATGRTVNNMTGEIGGLGLFLTENGGAGYLVSVVRSHYRGDDAGLRRVYSITSSTAPINTTMEIRYAEDDVPGDITDADLVLFRRPHDGLGWIEAGYTTRTSTTNSVMLTGVTEFSDWTPGSQSNTLPIELVSFTAALEDQASVKLDWVTASETNNNGFTIEKSTTGTVFETLGFVDGKGTTNERSVYSFLDLAPLATNYYRLKQTDYDGTTTYSSIRVVKLELTNALQAWPNPFINSLSISFCGAEDQPAVLNVYTSRGELITTYYQTLSSFRELPSSELEKLEPGVYLLSLYVAGQLYTTKVIKQ